MTKKIKQKNTKFKPSLFMKKNGDCVNIIWLDEGVSVGVGDNDQGYFFNENEWEMLNELLKPTRYSQETSEEKALNQIYELIASVRTNGAYPAESFVGGIIKDLLASSQKEKEKAVYVVTAYDIEKERNGEVIVLDKKDEALEINSKLQSIYGVRNVMFASRKINDIPVILQSLKSKKE